MGSARETQKFRVEVSVNTNIAEVLWMKECGYDVSQRRIATNSQCHNVRMNVEFRIFYGLLNSSFSQQH